VRKKLRAISISLSMANREITRKTINSDSYQIRRKRIFSEEKKAISSNCNS